MMFPQSAIIRKFRPALPIFILAGIILSQYYFDVEKLKRPRMPLTVIPAKAIKLGNLGLHSATASIMWLYTIQQVDVDLSKFPELIKTVNEIDPKFSYPYAFAALVLPGIKFPDQAVEIARAGIEKADPDWRIPYYLATTYHIFFQDRKNAAIYFDLAANTPGVPDKIKSIAARFGTYKTVLEQTKQIWISIYETSNDEFLRERSKNYIIHIEMIEVLEKAVSLYKKKYGASPQKIEDLVARKILKELPSSPLMIKFGLRADGSVTVE